MRTDLLMEPILPSFSPRSPVASLAARLMAEEGIGDYAVAKRKAKPARAGRARDSGRARTDARE